MAASDKTSTIAEPNLDDGASLSSHSTSRPHSPENKHAMSTNAADLEKGLNLHNGGEDKSQSRNQSESGGESAESSIVDWDGPDDPMNPHNWPRTKKIGIVVVIAMITFLTPLGSSMFAPATAEVMSEFKTSNPELASFVVSVYLLGYAFGPLIIAPLSELYGRMYLYHVCNILFIVFNVSCAVAPSLDSLIVFRFFAGAAGSCPLTLGAASLADMIRQEKRGAAMGAWALGPLVGPVVGPIAGGYLTEAMGWRWTFWILAIASGVVSINTFLFLSESCHPVLLERKRKRLVKETGNHNLKSVLDTGKTPKQLFLFAIIRPTKMLFLSPIVFLLSLFMAVVYGYLYLLFTTFANVFVEKYNFSTGSVGLAFLGIGVGSIMGLAISSAFSDTILQRLAKRNNGEMKPEYRIPLMIPGGLCVPIGLFWYGWTAEKGVHYLAPIVGTGFVGGGMIIIFMTGSTYLVDAFTIHAASAMAATTLLRSLGGAVLPLCGLKMYSTLGLGWGNSLLGFIALALTPIPWVFYQYGERMRTSKRFHVEF
ncbi:caffeine resistance protein [Histoplasma capsulatum var. duboisii H88]|uniref:Caffeine resistance protein n=2 Tax=Ajellomyces capsulatus TaxID=5037 RepID=F0UT86_AJEC8|nr:caffeine resistance protein [Histoplasma capsulatum var. duboisii H88]QSS54711.1 cycloheximide resistance protein [Histoplasma capsulatum var. duboisii H88]